MIIKNNDERILDFDWTKIASDDSIVLISIEPKLLQTILSRPGGIFFCVVLIGPKLF